LKRKYVVFKDDDVGKDFEKLKKWIDVVVENDAKAAIGLIGRYIKNPTLVDYLNTLDPSKIEIFCHGYSHGYFPFLLRKIIGRNKIVPPEFDRTLKSHDSSLSKYRDVEAKHLKQKAITFGPPGNIWNDSIIPALEKHSFKMMFSWWEIKGDILKIPLCANLKQNSLDEFVDVYEKHKDNIIFTLQFHHANLSDKQFDLMADVIDFLKNKEKRVFVTPSDLLSISKKDDEVMSTLSV
jgi:hypothetical protein